MQTTRLLRLLEAELLDAEEDIRDLERTLAQRFAALEITDHVYRENNALLEWELHGLARIRRVLTEIPITDIADLDTLTERITTAVRDQVEHHGLPGAVESIVGRRLARLLPLVSAPTPR